MSVERRQQILALARLDLGRIALSRRGAGIYVLAAFPLLPGLLPLLPRIDPVALDRIVSEHAQLFQIFFLRFFLYFAVVNLFSNLIRREIQEKSLHYWLLAPVRRADVVRGKFLGALLFASVLFALSALGSLIVFYLPHGGGFAMSQLFSPRVLGLLLAYTGISLLAVLVYGSLFLMVGLLFKSPILPAVGFWVWELGNKYMPGFLKPLSVVYFLKGMAPVPVSEGLIATTGELPSPWIGVPVLIGFVALCLWVSAWRFHRIEVSYGND